MNTLKLSLRASVAHAPATDTGSAPAKAFVPDAEVTATMNEIRSGISEEQYGQLRAAYKATFGTDTACNNEQLLYVIAASEDDMSPEDWAKAVQAHEAELTGGDDDGTDDDDVTDVSVSNRNSSAVGIAAKLADDAEFTKLVEALIDKRIEAETGAVPIMLALEKALGADVLRGMPFPNTTKEDVEGTNAEPDVYTVKVIDGGKRKKITGRFSWDIADCLPHAVELIKRYEQAKKDGPKGTKKLNTAQFNTVSGECRKKIAYNRQYVQSAIACWLNLDAIKAMPDMDAYFRVRSDDETKPDIKHPEPFIVRSLKKSELDFWASFSVTQFKSLRPAVAMANGGGYSALLDTMNRNGNAGGDGDEDAIENFAEFELRFLPIVNYLDTKGLDDLRLWLKRHPGTRAAMLASIQTACDVLEAATADYAAETREAMGKKMAAPVKAEPAKAA